MKQTENNKMVYTISTVTLNKITQTHQLKDRNCHNGFSKITKLYVINKKLISKIMIEQG